MQEHIRQAFLEAYDQHADAIYRHIFFRLLSREKAEELSQETFLKTWQYLESGKEVDNLRPFLYRVATNLVIDYTRKKREISLDETLEAHPQNEPMGLDASDVERYVLLGQIREALGGMNQEERDLITMRYIDDMDPKEIAQLLSITANHVSVKLNRAITKLKSRLTP